MDKMITTTFADRLASDSVKLFRTADSILQLHRQVQQCEAGALIAREDMFRICFRFLGLMGLYPTRVDGFPVKGTGLMKDHGLCFDLDYSVEQNDSTRGNGWNQGCGLMGPFEIIPLPTWNQIRTMFKEAFPKSSLTTILDADGLYHVTVREKYLPADGAISPIGAATCSNRRIATIQAIIRLMHAIVQEKLAAKQKTHATPWIKDIHFKIDCPTYAKKNASDILKKYRDTYADLSATEKESSLAPAPAPSRPSRSRSTSTPFSDRY